MFDTFKAKISSTTVIHGTNTSGRQYTPHYVFTFSKSFILFPNELKEVIKKSRQVNTYEVCKNVLISDRAVYTFLRKLEKYDLDRTKDSKFQINISHACNVNLIFKSPWDSFKFRWIHKRYKIQKWRWDLIGWATLILTGIGVYFDVINDLKKDNVTTPPHRTEGKASQKRIDDSLPLLKKRIDSPKNQAPDTSSNIP